MKHTIFKLRFNVKLNLICSDFIFSQVLLWTKQRCLLLTSAMLVQKGSASSTTSRLFGNNNEQWTICLKGTVWVCAQAVSVITDTLIIVATTMHGFNSGIYLGVEVPDVSNCKLIAFPQKTLDPHHSSSSHYRTSLTLAFEAWVTYHWTKKCTVCSDSVEVGETPPPTSVTDQLCQFHMLWAILIWGKKRQKCKTGQFFFHDFKYIYQDENQMCNGKLFWNFYLRGTFVELFDIMNNLFTGTEHTVELRDNNDDIKGPHNTWN